jgi:hypothetical protein
MDILGALTPDPLIVVDQHRTAPILDAQVKTLLLLPSGAEVAGDGLAFERDLAVGRLFRAVKPGSSRPAPVTGRHSCASLRSRKTSRRTATSVSLNFVTWRRT